ncbi:hypothetical protein S7711_08780 [Stachybotrys chartarum IBT 7711]|uniref:Uncharacterized protein n=1 Tax=Stachybotrys chartarum (strain CBS 109288 / IBT 7711) TaxID=1280523 RepID=A0A084AIW3_STACB|nr:hypothetical protein S7711_08780 [Stachybotrys chartarum IBT 7711]
MGDRTFNWSWYKGSQTDLGSQFETLVRPRDRDPSTATAEGVLLRLSELRLGPPKGEEVLKSDGEARAGGHLPGEAASLPSSPSSHSNDLYETHDPTYSLQQRQQSSFRHSQTPPDPTERLASPASTHRSLRRTPRFETTPSPEPRQIHIAAASIGFIPRVNVASQSRDDSRQVSTLAPPLEPEPLQSFKDRAATPRNSGNRTDDGESFDNLNPPGRVPQPPSTRLDQLESHTALRISKRTHSAILFALEEALRYPNSFTPDLEEEFASMADLLGGGNGMPPASNGNGSHASRRPTAAPAPTGSPSGIKGPRMIMQERQEREARQRARAEQERIRIEQEARAVEEARRQELERRTAGVAEPKPLTEPQGLGQVGPEIQQSRPNPSSHPQSQSQLQPQPQPQPQPQLQSQPHSQSRNQSSGQRLTSRYASNQDNPPPFNTTTTSTQQRPPQPQQPQQQPATAPPGDASSQPPPGFKLRNSFPHAFERWETLSAHWEGLTSYWIRKLEQNQSEINRDPISQQLSRQVTDLSAAGANLFHAVVELQRLRASSERKFQRWFIETRAELERAREVNSMLEAELEKERRERADAIRDALDNERGSSKAQKQLAEMRKELAISKEEARRAWEELGRREQEERDRTFSLQSSLHSGQPTFIGGVQVVPMTPGLPVSRYASSREYEQARTPEPTQPASTQPPPAPSAPGGPSGHYRTGSEGSSRPPAAPAAPGSEGGFSEGEYVIDAQGNFVLDSQGKRIAFAAPPSTISGSDVDAEDYQTPATTNPPSGGYDIPTSSGGPGQWTGAYSETQDYSGQGYAAPGWETVPRHHHPTRLSDVIEEEDERSRTSASQVSRA